MTTAHMHFLGIYECQRTETLQTELYREDDIFFWLSFDQIAARIQAVPDPTNPADFVSAWPYCATGSTQWCPGAYPPNF